MPPVCVMEASANVSPKQRMFVEDKTLATKVSGSVIILFKVSKQPFSSSISTL